MSVYYTNKKTNKEREYMSNITRATQAINTMSAAEIDIVIDAIKARRRAIQIDLKNALNPGDRVTFDYKGAKRVGTVVKRLVKNVKVEAMNQIWTITPSLLTKINN